MGCRIAGYGKALPDLTVTNDDLSRIVDTSDEWIVERTGIRRRRIAIGESGTDLAVRAASDALSAADVDPQTIDLVICMTLTGDYLVPSEAALVKARLGLGSAVAFDLNSACTGCIYGLEAARSMLTASHAVPGVGNSFRRALVVGVERLSRVTDWNDRSTCVLFGDGAGAVVLEWSDDEEGIAATFMKNTDDDALCLTVPNIHNPSTFPFAQEELAPCEGEPQEAAVRAFAAQGSPFLYMHGQKVFKFATASMVEAVHEVLKRCDLTIDDIACIVPHQANERIIRYAAKKLGLPMERFQLSIAETGNTSASSVLMALCDAHNAGRFAKGDYVLLVGFGGGLTSGAVVYRA